MPSWLVVGDEQDCLRLSECGCDNKFGNGGARSLPLCGDVALDAAAPRCKLLTWMLVRRQPPDASGSLDRCDEEKLAELDVELLDVPITAGTRDDALEHDRWESWNRPLERVARV